MRMLLWRDAGKAGGRSRQTPSSGSFPGLTTRAVGVPWCTRVWQPAPRPVSTRAASPNKAARAAARARLPSAHAPRVARHRGRLELSVALLAAKTGMPTVEDQHWQAGEGRRLQTRRERRPRNRRRGRVSGEGGRGQALLQGCAVPACGRPPLAVHPSASRLLPTQPPTHPTCQLEESATAATATRRGPRASTKRRWPSTSPARCCCPNSRRTTFIEQSQASRCGDARSRSLQ